MRNLSDHADQVFECLTTINTEAKDLRKLRFKRVDLEKKMSWLIHYTSLQFELNPSNITRIYYGRL